MADARFGRCRACHGLVRWAITEKGKPIPLDPNPSPDGTMLLVQVEGNDVARYWSAGPTRAIPRDVLYVVHFATCPDRGKSGKEVTQRALQRTLEKARQGL